MSAKALVLPRAPPTHSAATQYRLSPWALPFPVPSIHPPMATGYHTIESLSTPLQDLAQACAVLPTRLAFSDEGRVGSKKDTL